MSRRREREMAHIVSKDLSPCACPNCSHELTGVTAACIGNFFEKNIQLKGRPTMCCYCGALLIFADNAGRVRAMTEAERDSVEFAPVVERLYAMFRANARQAEDFTKSRCN